jgi:hypothetical protein
MISWAGALVFAAFRRKIVLVYSVLNLIEILFRERECSAGVKPYLWACGSSGMAMREEEDELSEAV